MGALRGAVLVIVRRGGSYVEPLRMLVVHVGDARHLLKRVGTICRGDLGEVLAVVQVHDDPLRWHRFYSEPDVTPVLRQGPRSAQSGIAVEPARGDPGAFPRAHQSDEPQQVEVIYRKALTRCVNRPDVFGAFESRLVRGDLWLSFRMQLSAAR